MAEFILKDRHGKDRTFDKETIFVQGADGELMQFTHGTGNPVIESLEITENGTYTVPEGVDGYNPVTVNVPAPEIKLQDMTITENGEYTADSGFDGLGTVTVNVAGSGGGLPAGGYWKFEKARKPTSYSNYFFLYKGKRYLYALSAYNDTKYDIYLHENDAYTLVATDVFTKGLDYYGVVEYNGVMHFIGGDTTSHYTWDGTSTGFEYQGALPSAASNDCAFVMDGELFYKSRKEFYKWDADSSTWEPVEVANCPSTTYQSMVVIGRKLYIVGYKKIYEIDWDAKTCTTLETAVSDGISGHGSLAVLGRYIYCLCSGSNVNELCAVYKYHVDNKTYEYVAGMPFNICELYAYNDKIYASGVRTVTHFHASIYEVTE